MIDVYSDVNTNKQEKMMSEVNWDLAPEGAETLEQSLKNVTWCQGGYWWAAKEGWKEKAFPKNWQIIATRPQTKTVADNSQTSCSEDEKWTHTTLLGKCRVLIDTPDEHGYLVVEMEDDGYSLVPPRSLKPLKPKLTKAQAWDMCQDYEGHKSMKKYMYDLHEQYEII